MDLRDSVCLVTGAGRRVGREIALALGRRAACVLVHFNRSGEEAEATATAIRAAGGRAAVVAGDLSDRDGVRRVCGEADRAFGPVQVLVNNASVYEATPLSTLDEAVWDRVLAVNLKAPAFLSRHFGLAMKRSGRGKIVNIADWAGERPYAGYLPYCVSKAGLLALTRALAKELAPEIQVNAVNPGPVLLPEGMDPGEAAEALARTPLARVGSPGDVVAAVLFFLEGTDFATGSVLAVDGGRTIE